MDQIYIFSIPIRTSGFLYQQSIKFEVFPFSAASISSIYFLILLQLKPSKVYCMSITSSTIGKKTYKVVLLGDSSTGKTSIIQRFVNNKFQEKDNPTIGIDFVGKNISHKQNSCRLQLWDTAGQQRYRSLIPSYLKDAICAIFVFDVTRPQTLQNIQTWIQLFRQNRGQKTVMVLCANKVDLEDCYQKKMVNIIVEKYKMVFKEVSAKEGTNIQAMFYTLIDQIIIMQQRKKKKIQDDTDFIAPLTHQNLTSAQTDRRQENQGQKIKLNQEGEEEKRKKWLCC